MGVACICLIPRHVPPSDHFSTVDPDALTCTRQVIVSAVAMAFYLPIGVLFTMADMDLNPSTLSNLSCSNSMVELICLGIKATMIIASVSGGDHPVLHAHSNPS